MTAKEKDILLKKALYILPLLLLLPALLINLGILAFKGDEGIRALVAYEMFLSDNYVTPTLHGEYYYKKPPLFNWMILALFKWGGQFKEYIPRLITVVMLISYSATVWHFYRKHFDKMLSFLIVFSLITCGRILFWDSFIGLIDISFSFVIFSMFMVIYHRFQEGKITRLFVEAYILAAIAFLLKGFPSIVFIGITFLTLFIYKKSFRKLFAPAHFLGVFLFVLILGSYYLLYNQYNPVENIFLVLFDESSQRTAIRFGLWKVIRSIFTFPFEMTYHFLPWSILIIFLLVPKNFREIQKHDFLFANLLFFLANILVYWISPGIYPRYLLMFPPLIFAPIIYLFLQDKKVNGALHRYVEILLGFGCVFLTIASVSPHFLERLEDIAALHLKAISITIVMLPLLYLYFKMKSHRLLIFISFLLLTRIAFDWFIVPDRLREDTKTILRKKSLEFGEKYKDTQLYIFEDTYLDPNLSFYLTRGSEKIIPRKFGKIDSNTKYLVDKNFRDLDYTIIDSLNLPCCFTSLRVVKFKE